MFDIIFAGLVNPDLCLCHAACCVVVRNNINLYDLVQLSHALCEKPSRQAPHVDFTELTGAKPLLASPRLPSSAPDVPPRVLQVLKDRCLLSSAVEHQIAPGLNHPGFLTL